MPVLSTSCCPLDWHLLMPHLTKSNEAAYSSKLSLSNEGEGGWGCRGFQLYWHIYQKSVVRRESEQGTSLEPLSPGGYGSPGDPLTGPEQTRYRIASVGQDCRLLLWDFTVEEADFSDELDFTTAPQAPPTPLPPPLLSPCAPGPLPFPSIAPATESWGRRTPLGWHHVSLHISLLLPDTPPPLSRCIYYITTAVRLLPSLTLQQCDAF